MNKTIAPLPLKNGVAASYVCIPHNYGLLIDFLTARFPQVSYAVWVSRMMRHEVVRHDGVVLNTDSPCLANSKVYYYREVAAETPIPFLEQILFQDEHLIVVDKPHFLPVTPTGSFLQETLLTRLRRRLNMTHISPIHRLDKDTAGVILFAAQAQSRDAYQGLFRQQKVQKIYHALARTRLDLVYPTVHESQLLDDKQYFFRTRTADGTPNSRTTITLLEARGEHSVYQLEPTTGKKHQLRVHMNSLDMPIINDVLYPVTHELSAADYAKPLQLLAKSIAFIDPITGESRRFESPREL